MAHAVLPPYALDVERPPSKEGSIPMRTHFSLLLAAGLIIPGAAAYSQAMTDTDCTALFSKADINKDDAVSGPELTPFQSALMLDSEQGTAGSATGSTGGGSTSAEATTSPMTRDQFMTECKSNANFSGVTIP